MHESGMMKGLMREIERAVADRAGCRVASVKVSVGVLTQMSPDHFRHHFEEAAAGTPAEGATLDVEVIDDLTDEAALDVRLREVTVAP